MAQRATKTTPKNMCYKHIKKRGSASESPPPNHTTLPSPTYVQPQFINDYAQHPETLETIDPCQTQPYRTVPRTLPRAISVNFALICLQMRATVTHSRNTWRGRIPWSSWSSFDFLFVQCCPGERFVLDKIYRFLQRVIAHTSHIACTFTYIHTYICT